MMLQASLGVRIDGWRGEVHIHRPRLPIGIDQLLLRHLAVGQHTVDIVFQRVGEGVVANVLCDQGGDSVPVIVHI
jgi:hypothetical protein